MGWQEALSDDADLLFYGCDLAAHGDGEHFLESLAALTGADIAASDDLTGHADLGGDWDLEYSSGTIETGVAFDVSTQQRWESILATYIVTNTSDSGAGSLRDAINQANASVGVDDTIEFNIVGTGVHTIALATDLPFITDTVTIDATTDDSFAANGNRPAVILDGNNLSSDGLVLTSSADGSTIRGLIIRDFAGDGIEIQAGSDGNTIAGNYIGDWPRQDRMPEPGNRIRVRASTCWAATTPSVA